MNMQNITTSTIIRFFLVGILLFALYYIADVVLAVVAAVVLASSIEPGVLFLKKYKLNRIITVIILYLVIGIVLAGLLIFFIPIVGHEFVSFMQNIPESLSFENFWLPVQNLGIGRLQDCGVHIWRHARLYIDSGLGFLPVSAGRWSR